MSYELVLALMGFAFVSSVTPGPNNMMLMASGANYGLRRSLPHMFGVGIGHSFMICVLGVGLIQVFELYPVILDGMKLLSALYLCYLAYKIATAAPKVPDATDSSGKPFTFLQAAAFQWVNPKGWFMALTAITVYTADQSIGQVVLVAIVFALTNFPSISLWTLMGQGISRLLKSPKQLRFFNWTMAALLILSLVPVFLNH